jgi:hypothetical protein
VWIYDALMQVLKHNYYERLAMETRKRMDGVKRSNIMLKAQR